MAFCAHKIQLRWEQWDRVPCTKPPSFQCLTVPNFDYSSILRAFNIPSFCLPCRMFYIEWKCFSVHLYTYILQSMLSRFIIMWFFKSFMHMIPHSLPSHLRLVPPLTRSLQTALFLLSSPDHASLKILNLVCLRLRKRWSQHAVQLPFFSVQEP